MKTSELTGAALDWAVAKCEGWERDMERRYHSNDPDFQYEYSTDWAQGGSIIEREKIDVFHQDNGYTGAIKMATDADPHPRPYFGPTPLIAAMRCYVASKLGDEVEIPEELK